MSDCSNVTMREMLPDLLNGGLGAQARAQVESHVASCADCRAELELLRQVKAITATPRVDVARIAGAIAPYRAPTIWKSAVQSWPMRAAAAVILVAGTATVMRLSSGTIDQPDSVLAVAPAPDFGVGAMADISDNDLKAIAAELGKMKAVTPAEPEVVVPSVGRGSGDGGGQ